MRMGSAVEVGAKAQANEDSVNGEHSTGVAWRALLLMPNKNSFSQGVNVSASGYIPWQADFFAWMSVLPSRAFGGRPTAHCSGMKKPVTHVRCRRSHQCNWNDIEAAV